MSGRASNTRYGNRAMCVGMVMTFCVITTASCSRRDQVDVPYPADQPTSYRTAHDAYETVRSAIAEWHSDAIVVNVGSLLTDDEIWRIRDDGKAPLWSFTIQSPGELQATSVTLINDKIVIGVDANPGHVKSIRNVMEAINISDMIDSDQAVEIALRVVGISGRHPESIGTTSYTTEGDPIATAWRIRMSPALDGDKPLYITIDAISGEIIE